MSEQPATGGGRISGRLVATHLAVAVAAGAVFGIAAALGLAAGWAALLGGAVALAVATVLASTTSRWVAAPLDDLARTANGALTSVADTAPATFLPRLAEVGPDEVRSLAGALNHVRSGVNARFTELNREAGLREQILSSMSEGVVLADATGRILYANPAAHDLLSGAAILPAPLRAEGPVELTLRHPRRRELKATCLRLEDGRRLVAMQDVTEAKRIEAMRRDFVADASHELKTPVASILAVAETLETAVEDDPAAVPIFMRTLLGETRRMSSLVQDLLDLARLEGRAGERTVVSLSHIAGRETARVRQDAEVKGLLLK
ncbi:MAG TPA: histidine kinase dimerization/phospho-acceptor domain-containing protein, partial [Actinomycetota bacterium]|nr:histidine kinase dimerization/phospho-acceptor domain-containing protein [Actinomycetota bacterium]